MRECGVARPPKGITAAQRFWALTAVAGADDCWLWEGYTVGGYGRLSVDGKTIGAHRFSYELFVAAVPEGHEVMHTCDNPTCVNPRHLTTGTHADNITDMWVKGRGRATGNIEIQRAMSRLSAPERLLARTVRPNGDDGCWIFTGAGTRSGTGHGKLLVGGKLTYAHRLSYEVHVGPIPDGMVVRHRCDVPQCVNPAHLHLGTQADNVADNVRRGRVARGEAVKSAKLTEAKVREIRARYVPYTVSCQTLANEYGVSLKVIEKIVKRRAWQHVI